jgi:hypothetical protein
MKQLEEYKAEWNNAFMGGFFAGCIVGVLSLLISYWLFFQ